MKIFKLALGIMISLAFVIFCSFVDFTEISDYDIITGIAIDRENDEWIVTCEMISPSTNNDFGSSAIYIKGKGYTLYNALEDTSLKSPSTMYTDSVQLYLISNNVFSDNCVRQYFLDTNVNLRAFVLSVDGKAFDVLNSEENDSKRAKCISIADKVRNYCEAENSTFPDITDYLKGGTGIVLNNENTPQRRVNEFE